MMRAHGCLTAIVLAAMGLAPGLAGAWGRAGAPEGGARVRLSHVRMRSMDWGGHPVVVDPKRPMVLLRAPRTDTSTAERHFPKGAIVFVETSQKRDAAKPHITTHQPVKSGTTEVHRSDLMSLGELARRGGLNTDERSLAALARDPQQRAELLRSLERAAIPETVRPGLSTRTNTLVTPTEGGALFATREALYQAILEMDEGPGAELGPIATRARGRNKGAHARLEPERTGRRLIRDIEERWTGGGRGRAVELYSDNVGYAFSSLQHKTIRVGRVDGFPVLHIDGDGRLPFGIQAPRTIEQVDVRSDLTRVPGSEWVALDVARLVAPVIPIDSNSDTIFDIAKLAARERAGMPPIIRTGGMKMRLGVTLGGVEEVVRVYGKLYAKVRAGAEPSLHINLTSVDGRPWATEGDRDRVNQAARLLGLPVQ